MRKAWHFLSTQCAQHTLAVCCFSVFCRKTDYLPSRGGSKQRTMLCIFFHLRRPLVITMFVAVERHADVTEQQCLIEIQELLVFHSQQCLRIHNWHSCARANRIFRSNYSKLKESVQFSRLFRLYL